VEPFGEFMPLSSFATERTPYLRTQTQCQSAGQECYAPLITSMGPHANVQSDVKFGGDPQEDVEGVRFVGATANLAHVALESDQALLPTLAGAESLYDWSGEEPGFGALRLVSILPSPEGGGTGVPANLGYQDVSTQNAISSDGNRYFWTTTGLGRHLYVRDLDSEESARLDLLSTGVGSGAETPLFEGASADGSTALFLDEQKLVKGASATGTDLYVCRLPASVEAGCQLEDLTPTSGRQRANVQGVMDVSNDASLVFFVAKGVLASNEGAAGEEAVSGQDNMYLTSYDSHTKKWSGPEFIVGLSEEDSSDWATSLAHRTTKLSQGNAWFEFMSNKSLTGYDNDDVVSKEPDEEVFLYNATLKKIIVPGYTPFDLEKATYQSRFLDAGGRLFFNSYDSLVPQDVNGTSDIYEYEPVGVGDCEVGGFDYSQANDGCTSLVSSGTSLNESAFLDASEDGSTVFFLTDAKLLWQDYDTSLDIYDARVCTVASPCLNLPEPSSACSTSDSCRAAPSPQPGVFGVPPSGTFAGEGNTSPLSKAKVAPRKKLLTKSQKLTKALKQCTKMKKAKRRASCRKQARKRYAIKGAGKASARKSGEKGKGR
jgi:hypothetical protein